MFSRSFTSSLPVLLLAALTLAAPVRAEVSLLNVSYDVARDFYKDYNPVFQKYWKGKTGENVDIKQSHGGSSKQARSVGEGLEADVVTMNQALDVDFLAERGLVAKDWAKKFPNGAAPYTSVTVFIVRKGNPLAIKDWPDIEKPGVQVILAHPKNTGNGRYAYLGAWGYALKQKGGNEKTAQEAVSKLLKNAPLFATGGRDATTIFMQRHQGDVLVTFENEAEMIAKEFGRGEFEVVYPSLTIAAEAPVAVVETVVDKKKSRAQATAYLQYLWSKEGQEIAAQNYLRPQDAAVLKKYASQFPPVKTFTIDEVFGGWGKALKTHFVDGGSFDQIFQH